MTTLWGQYEPSTIKRLRVFVGVKKNVSDEFLHSRKSGLFKKDNIKKRFNFVFKVTKMLTCKFWEESISFYIDDAWF